MMQAEAAFATKDFHRAASFYAKVISLFLSYLMYTDLVCCDILIAIFCILVGFLIGETDIEKYILLKYINIVYYLSTDDTFKAKSFGISGYMSMHTCILFGLFRTDTSCKQCCFYFSI